VKKDVALIKLRPGIQYPLNAKRFLPRERPKWGHSDIGNHYGRGTTDLQAQVFGKIVPDNDSILAWVQSDQVATSHVLVYP
jgi:hypothetical protein